MSNTGGRPGRPTSLRPRNTGVQRRSRSGSRPTLVSLVTGDGRLAGARNLPLAVPPARRSPPTARHVTMATPGPKNPNPVNVHLLRRALSVISMPDVRQTLPDREPSNGGNESGRSLASRILKRQPNTPIPNGNALRIRLDQPADPPEARPDRLLAVNGADSTGRHSRLNRSTGSTIALSQNLDLGRGLARPLRLDPIKHADHPFRGFGQKPMQFAPLPVASPSRGHASAIDRYGTTNIGADPWAAPPDDGPSPHLNRGPPDLSGNHQGAPGQGMIYLDGSALGHWMADHLGQLLSRPDRGPSGIDPRVMSGWGPLTAAF